MFARHAWALIQVLPNPGPALSDGVHHLVEHGFIRLMLGVLVSEVNAGV